MERSSMDARSCVFTCCGLGVAAGALVALFYFLVGFTRDGLIPMANRLLLRHGLPASATNVRLVVSSVLGSIMAIMIGCVGVVAQCIGYSDCGQVLVVVALGLLLAIQVLMRLWWWRQL